MFECLLGIPTIAVVWPASSTYSFTVGMGFECLHHLLCTRCKLL
jgi:hypothetical protein